MEATFSEQISSLLGQDFFYPYSSCESNTTTSLDQWDVDNFIIEPITQNNNNNNNDYKHNNNDNGSYNIDVQNQKRQHIEELKKEVNNNKTKSGGGKRKRQPNQVQDHIIAERRRREVLSQMIITLSSLVPGLKKIDKTSVLGEAIKYMKKLQEKVKTLEAVDAKRTTESMVVVKKSQLIIADDNENENENDSTSAMDANSAYANNSSNNGDEDNEMNKYTNSLSEIEMKISYETMLLKVHCENKKGVLTKLLDMLENHGLSITICNVVPFGSFMLDITIISQMQKGFKINVKTFVRSLHQHLDREVINSEHNK